MPFPVIDGRETPGSSESRESGCFAEVFRVETDGERPRADGKHSDTADGERLEGPVRLEAFPDAFRLFVPRAA